MILIVCLDENNGMMFNNRRQSRDKEICRRILKFSDTNKLWMNNYSAKLFEEELHRVNVDDCFMGKAMKNEYCFVENIDVSAYEKLVEKIIIYYWNRLYPADLKFDIHLNNQKWKIANTEEFAGNSHKKITGKVYIK